MDLSKKKIQLNSNDLVKIKEKALNLFKEKSAPLGYEENNTTYIWIETVVDFLNTKGVEVEITYRTKG
jgi:hypothetical protein